MITGSYWKICAWIEQNRLPYKRGSPTSLPRSFVILLCESMEHLLPAFVMP